MKFAQSSVRSWGRGRRPFTIVPMSHPDLPDADRTATPVRGTRLPARSVSDQGLRPGFAPEPRIVGVDEAGRDITVAVRPPQGRGGAGRRRGTPGRRRPVLKVLGATVLALVMLTGLGSVYLYRHLNGNLTVKDVSGDVLIKQPKHVIPAGPNGPQNILVMGDDTRDCAGCHIDGESGAGGSDTTILIHLSADHEHAYGISIPRDTLVNRPECKTTSGGVSPAADDQMWNAAYTVGGAACTIAQTEAVTGIPIDHYVVVDFASFQTMVDALGGVQVCLPQPLHDPMAQLNLPAGTQTLTGLEALDYVRERHAIGDGSDLGRTRRQQAFIGAMVNKLMTAGTLANPIKVIKFADAATKGLTVDPGLGDLRKLAGLAYDFRHIGLGHIQFLTAPVELDPSDTNRVILTPEAHQLWQALLHDKTLSRSLTSQALSANDLPGQGRKKHHKARLSEAQKAYMQQYGLCTNQ